MVYTLQENIEMERLYYQTLNCAQASARILNNNNNNKNNVVDVTVLRQVK